MSETQRWRCSVRFGACAPACHARIRARFPMRIRHAAGLRHLPCRQNRLSQDVNVLRSSGLEDAEIHVAAALVRVAEACAVGDFCRLLLGTGLSASAPLRRARVSLSACAASTSCNSLQGWYSRRRRCPMRIAADAQLLSRALPMRYRIIATFSSSQAGAPAARWPRRSARPVRASPQDRLTLISKNWSARVWPRLMAAIGRPNSLARRQKR